MRPIKPIAEPAGRPYRIRNACLPVVAHRFHLREGIMSLHRVLGSALWLYAAAAPSAGAAALSFTGTLDAGNPNDVLIVGFELVADASLTIQTWGYGGTGNAPGGVNAAGEQVLPGGFDPYVSLFAGSGVDATFVASNDDGVCPSGMPFPVCADSTLQLGRLAAGQYTLALTLPFNYSFAENQGEGTLGDGFIGLDSSYSDGACAGVCSSDFALDVSSAALVPEPPPLQLMLAGGLAAWLARRRAIARRPDSSARPALRPLSKPVVPPTRSTLLLLPWMLLTLAGAATDGAMAQTKAAAVRDIDRPQAQPVANECHSTPSSTPCALFVVPAGKVLRVESVSFAVVGYDASYRLGTVLFYGFTPMYLNPGPPGVVAGTMVLYNGAQPLAITLSAGATLYAAATALTGSFSGNFTFNGYLVDQ
jgi:hypothetical protein